MVMVLAESFLEFIVIAVLGVLTCAVLMNHALKAREAVAAPSSGRVGPARAQGSAPGRMGTTSGARPHRRYDPVQAVHPISDRLRKEERKRIMDVLNRSTLVVATPNHTAVVLRYEFGDGSTPTVTLKGNNLKGLKILEVARQLDVPVFRSSKLAMQLYNSVNANKPIRHEHYVPVAELVSQVV